METFESFLSLLRTIPDPRRAEGKRYGLPHLLLFSILAIVTGADSYRGICTFIKVHRESLNAGFGIAWKRAPAHTAIRYVLQKLNPADVETSFRAHAANLNGGASHKGPRALALDGKGSRGNNRFVSTVATVPGRTAK
jgi:hypothetical protein